MMREQKIVIKCLSRWLSMAPSPDGVSSVTLLCVIPLLLLLLACSGSGEGEDEDECLRASSTRSLLFDSNSRASCSFLLAFFSFLRRFWMEAVETQQGHFLPTVPWHGRACARRPLAPLLWSSEVSCRSRLSLISLSRYSSIFSSLFSAWICLSCTRAFSTATFSRP